jgi:integrase
MGKPFRPVSVYYLDSEGHKVAPGTPGAQKVTKESPVYYGRFKDASGQRVTVALVANKRDSEMMLAKLATDARLDFAGLKDQFSQHRQKSLAQHLDEFEQSLLSDNNTPKHARQTSQRARKLFKGCHFKTTRDVQASRVTEWLADERRAGRLTITTSNYYQRDAKSFFTWMVKDKRLEHNPLVHLSPLNAEVEDHRERRAMDSEEYALLLQTVHVGPVIRNLAGPDRFMLYLIASNTGLRPIELSKLVPENFALESDNPTVTVPAAYSKHRREDVREMREDLAQVMREYLADKPAGRSVWPGAWWKHGAKMMRADLKAARKKWIDEAGDDAKERLQREESDFLAYQDHAGRYFDFYAQRGQMLTALEQSGVSLKTLQYLARHSRVETTLKHYTRSPKLADARAALDALPPLPIPSLPFQGEILQATGTDGPSARTQSVHIMRSQAISIAITGPENKGNSGLRHISQEVGNVRVESPCERMSRGERKEAPPGFEPGMADLQSYQGLPLHFGYPSNRSFSRVS